MSTELSHEAFVELVAKMLAAQQLYFNTRSPACLDDAKRLERETRKAIAAHQEAKRRVASGQKDLF